MQGILMWPWYAIAWINGAIIKIKFKFILLILICPLILYVDATIPTTENRVLRSEKIINIYDKVIATKEAIETSLQTIHDIATENLGTLCVSQSYRPLKISINAERYEGARQKADLAAIVLQDVGVNHHGGLLDALAKGLLSDPHVIAARILATNVTTGILATSVWWSKHIGGLGGPNRVDADGVAVGAKPSNNYPWYADESSLPVRSPKFAPSPLNISYRGWWTFPYYSCNQKRWILSYSVAIPPIGRHGMRGFLSIDIDVSELQVNQCEIVHRNELNTYQEQLMQIEAFHGSNKCHSDNMKCEYRPLLNVIGQTVLLYTNLNSYNINSNSINNNNMNINSNYNINNKNLINVNGWLRGAYQCLCKQGYYSIRHPYGFNGTIMEVAYQEYKENVSRYYQDIFRCLPCAKGCDQCFGPSPCLATYNWPFRISILTISILCAIFTHVLACYMLKHRKVKVFKVASPIFLTITLVGCAIMYLEMAAIFPILDTYACIATKWTRHMGFCVTYTALLMKTWRVSLTYRVKSAHKVKLTDKQLLQWMVPILLVMLIYLGTWTLSAPPIAEVITDQYGLKFKQCSYNWWDHSLAIGEVLFLAWGIRVCYNVRNAESLYNEARLISFAIYNIALVNTLMVAIHLFIFPQAGPDIKYLLGFVRTQLSTTVTIALVFVPKVIRIIRGQGDQWDSRAKVRGITASFSLNGIGLVPDDSPDLYQENEELKEEIQKLAAQIEFMKIVNMEMNNRHLKPKPGGYFTISSTVQSPLNKSTNTQIFTTKKSQTPQQQQIEQLNNSGGISDDGHSGSNSLGTNSIGYAPPLPQHTPIQNSNNNNNNNNNTNNNNNNNGNTTTNSNEKV